MNGVILTSYFSAKQHPQLGDPDIEGVSTDGRVFQNDIQYIGRWYDSVSSLKLNGVVFHDNLSEDFVDKYSNGHVTFVKVDTSEYSNNDYRFFCFKDWVNDHKEEYDWIFHNDGSDVTVISDPSDLFLLYPNVSYFACKDTYLLSEFPYLKFHRHFQWDNFFEFSMFQQSWDLINMGVVGGKTKDMVIFYNTFCEVREAMGEIPLNSDMWILQYLLREKIKHNGLLIGDPVTSVYKGYESWRKDVYFIHK